MQEMGGEKMRIRGRKWESGTVPFPTFFGTWEWKMGIRDGSFSHFSFYEKWEKEPSLIPIFPLSTYEKWEKEPSLIPIFLTQAPWKGNP